MEVVGLRDEDWHQVAELVGMRLERRDTSRTQRSSIGDRDQALWAGDGGGKGGAGQEEQQESWDAGHAGEW